MVKNNPLTSLPLSCAYLSAAPIPLARKKPSGPDKRELKYIINNIKKLVIKTVGFLCLVREKREVNCSAKMLLEAGPLFRGIKKHDTPAVKDSRYRAEPP